jgi:hypothetical protein
VTLGCEPRIRQATSSEPSQDARVNLRFKHAPGHLGILVAATVAGGKMSAPAIGEGTVGERRARGLEAISSDLGRMRAELRAIGYCLHEQRYAGRRRRQRVKSLSNAFPQLRSARLESTAVGTGTHPSTSSPAVTSGVPVFQPQSRVQEKHPLRPPKRPAEAITIGWPRVICRQHVGGSSPGQFRGNDARPRL